MNIITISREFGSGGRELGKRLAEALGYAYYDREILTMLYEQTALNEDYLESTMEENSMVSTVALTVIISEFLKQLQKFIFLIAFGKFSSVKP